MGALILYWLTKFLVGLFLAGLVGSAVVVIITFVEDGQLLLERDEQKKQEPREENTPARSSAREAY